MIVLLRKLFLAPISLVGGRLISERDTLYPRAPSNSYVAEDGLTYYLAEDNLTYYTKES